MHLKHTRKTKIKKGVGYSQIYPKWKVNMIDEDKTMELYGYYSTDLTPKSSKKIVCICDWCGKERVLKKSGHSDYCLSCSQLCKYISPETRKKMSEARMGRKSPMLGKHHSQETKDKIAEGNRGKFVSLETRQKLREANTGKHPTPETRKKLSAAMVKRHELRRKQNGR